MRTRRPTLVPPSRGDVVAGITVALVLVPQSLAYAQIAGTPPVHGLYTAVAATLAAGLIGSSPYLQTGPVALTSLLTFGALAPLVTAGTAEFAAHAAVLALVVGVVRIALGVLRGGVLAYLMSQPVITSFTAAAAILIVASQLPALLDVPGTSASPLLSAGRGLLAPASWEMRSLAVGAASIALILGGRRLSARFPGALLATVLALGASAAGWLGVTTVGEVPSGLPALELALPWGSLTSLLVPGVVIALVGFAEPASIARKYAAEDRQSWDPDKELVGQGLANVASGAFGGYPAGGSFSRSALNRESGARTRWSGVITGLSVLCVLPFASVLSYLPAAALAGLVVASVVTLLYPGPFVELWRFSRPQFAIAAATFVSTLAFAPRVERGVMTGVVLSLGMHLWRELVVNIESWQEGDTLHIRPQGVLYFGSAPSLQTEVLSRIAEHDEVKRVLIHLDRLGRLDLTGALALRSLLQELEAGGTRAVVDGPPPQARPLVDRILLAHRLVPAPTAPGRNEI